MSDLDSLIESSISLISHQDVRYDGILFTINTTESSIVLKDVKCFGTEDRVTDPSKKVQATPDKIIAFVNFPGSEIKDLMVHEQPTPAPAPDAKSKPASKSKQQKPPPAAAPPPAATAPPPAAAPPPAPEQGSAQGSAPTSAPHRGTAGTGAHLMRMKVRKGADSGESIATGTTFDFSAGLNLFKKQEEMQKVEQEKTKDVAKYQKDDFFDTMSCDLTDRQEGIKSRLTYSEERTLNQDTFGAIALQNNNYRRGNYRGGRGGRGYRGRGRGGGRGSNSSNWSRNGNNNNQSTAPAPKPTSYANAAAN